ncbi:MAG TPA: VOC family protein [Geminicoccaceae bacterium]|nr:VOC family protein [Geminicoccaceae bacterium]
MHKSRLGAIIIDCQTEDAEAAAAFWGVALGYEVRPTDDPRYVDLAVPEDQPQIGIQKVDHESRVHLDIETDDVEAEVARLEALGAKRVAQVKSWWVMRAPTGQKFCVVKPQRKDFAAKAPVRRA